MRKHGRKTKQRKKLVEWVIFQTSMALRHGVGSREIKAVVEAAR